MFHFSAISVFFQGASPRGKYWLCFTIALNFLWPENNSWSSVTRHAAYEALSWGGRTYVGLRHSDVTEFHGILRSEAGGTEWRNMYTVRSNYSFISVQVTPYCCSGVASWTRAKLKNLEKMINTGSAIVRVSDVLLGRDIRLDSGNSIKTHHGIYEMIFKTVRIYRHQGSGLERKNARINWALVALSYSRDNCMW